MQLGKQFIIDRFRLYAHLVDHLSDISPARLGVPLSRLYEMLLRVPIGISRDRCYRELSRESKESLDRLFESHDSPPTYAVRDALVFGIAECRRSEAFAERVAVNDREGIAALIQCSHDSEQNVGAVSTFSPTGLGVGLGHESLLIGFYDALFKSGVRELGGATLAAKLRLFQAGYSYDLINTYTIFGDPALRIPIIQSFYFPSVFR